MIPRLRSGERPRLMVFRSNRYIDAQIVDSKGKVLVQVLEKKLSLPQTLTKAEKAFKVGEEIARLALRAKIKKIAFDRRCYHYLGRVKSLAEGSRKGGLEF